MTRGQPQNGLLRSQTFPMYSIYTNHITYLEKLYILNTSNIHLVIKKTVRFLEVHLENGGILGTTHIAFSNTPRSEDDPHPHPILSTQELHKS